ncbi:hypothetical protein F441_18781 [Phytophthora nicotianae CJ01A1]|uniref:Uncharacterized protein n=1 Tax=Phytophthora nicotianae CJ01A1 TaxID=1317063 RepID=W2W1J7_PHYNI|nr:hypothetical protein F441_18781 [Phytophthora nicotianae CJ01A1]
MLSLSLLAARTRLLRTPTATHCVSIAARSVSNNTTAISTQFNHLLVPKSRAFSTINSPKDEDEEVTEELSVDEDDDEKNQPINGDDPFTSEWNLLNDKQKNKSSSRSSGVFKRNTFRRRGNSDRHWKLGRRAEGHLISKDMDEIDYDAELENVWDEEQLKQRKFHQALRREQDKDHVCTNCGERGHRRRVPTEEEEESEAS